MLYAVREYGDGTSEREREAEQAAEEWRRSHPSSKRVRLLPPRLVVAIHAAQGRHGLPLCGAPAGPPRPIRQRWADPSLPGDRRCSMCSELVSRRSGV